MDELMNGSQEQSLDEGKEAAAGVSNVRKDSPEGMEGLLLADLVSDAMPDNQLLPSQLLAQLSSDTPLSLASQFFPPPGGY